ncbi:MAG: RNA methyltransferase [bacterium]|nr:RNA methyltransferase [bacterium]
MLVYGKQVAKEASRAGVRPKKVWCKRTIYDFAKGIFPNSEIRVVHPKIISSICKSDEHQGIAFEIDVRMKKIHDIEIGLDSCIVLLDRVQDVGNIGNIIRTSEFFGATCIVISKEQSPDITPAMIKSSAGAFFHIPVIKEKSEELIKFAKNRGFKIYSFDLRAKTNAKDTKFELPAVLCFGGEERGLSEKVLELSDVVVKISGYGKTESLNVSSAVAASFGILTKSLYNKSSP